MPTNPFLIARGLTEDKTLAVGRPQVREHVTIREAVSQIEYSKEIAVDIQISGQVSFRYADFVERPDSGSRADVVRGHAKLHSPIAKPPKRLCRHLHFEGAAYRKALGKGFLERCWNRSRADESAGVVNGVSFCTRDGHVTLHGSKT
jgi:hypothetical protein